MTEAEYFAFPAVSNSALSSLQNELLGIAVPEFSHGFYTGTLLDNLITERRRINLLEHEHDNKEIPAAVIANVKQMAKAFWKNPFCTQLIKGAALQKISLFTREFLYNDIPFSLPCKCKWDFFNEKGISGDIKTTVATTLQQFLKECEFRQYFRARAWYMDLENTRQDIIIGISKVNFQIFLVPITKGDANYLRGQQQYLRLAFYYWTLKAPVNDGTISLPSR